MTSWDRLPEEMRIDEIRPYYDVLMRKQFSLFLKRAFDMVISVVLIIILFPVMLIMAAAIKIDSKGPAFYRQERVTTFGKHFYIHKFRSMFVDSDKGSKVTVEGDKRITRMGKFMRKIRLDELPQLFDILCGNMTFVGVRPEVVKYVDLYKPEWKATLLLPAGVTNLTSILFKDEDSMLLGATDIDKVYVEKILPEKMKLNLQGIKSFSIFSDMKILIMTVLAVCGKNYNEKKCV